MSEEYAEHNFTLIIEGDVEAKMDELFEAGCDDATFGSVDGVHYGEFDREAASFAEALASAIAAVESVEGLRVRRIEPEDLVTAAEIATRLRRSRESVRLLIAGRRRRAGDVFPAPISHARQRNRLWRWSEVARWAGEISESEMAHARVVAATNAALELRSLNPDDGERLIALSQ
jgi:hypothetical protein